MTRPNIVMILADDMGYADMGCTGNPAQPTPHLDQLARSGMLMTSAYANSSVCSPTRFALATGRYQYRLRAGAEEPLGRKTLSGESIGLVPSDPTFMSRLNDGGYRTGLVGKWHLGYPPAHGPRQSGYGYFYGTHAGALDYFSHMTHTGDVDLWENEEPVRADGYITDLFTDKAVAFIKNQSDERPFMLSVHYTAPHWPWETRWDKNESVHVDRNIQHTDGGSLAVYNQMIHHMDEGIGRIVHALKENGQLENTLIVFTSDNGGERFSNNWPFVGQKMDLLEGGIRVPTVVHWPRVIQNASISNSQCITMDWSATFLDVAGVAQDPTTPMDGRSLLQVFTNPNHQHARDLHWRMLHRQQKALIRGRWKYLSVDGHEYLFDIENDPRERANLVSREPDRFQELKAAWQDWNASMPPIPSDASYKLVYEQSHLPIPTR